MRQMQLQAKLLPSPLQQAACATKGCRTILLLLMDERMHLSNLTADLQGTFAAGAWSPQRDALADPGWMLPLCVFCRVYTTFISTSADTDMYKHQRPLPLTELYDPAAPRSGVLALLKFALWHVLWTESTSSHGEQPSCPLSARLLGVVSHVAVLPWNCNNSAVACAVAEGMPVHSESPAWPVGLAELMQQSATMLTCVPLRNADTHSLAVQWLCRLWPFAGGLESPKGLLNFA